MKRVLLAAGMMALALTGSADTGWTQYGGDQGGQRHSAATQITPANVDGPATGLELFDRGDDAACRVHAARPAFENTPILNEGKLFVCSPFQEVSALDPGTGKQIWRFDPHLSDDSKLNYPNGFNCRGVAYWKGGDGKGRDLSRRQQSPSLSPWTPPPESPSPASAITAAAVIYDGKLRREGADAILLRAGRQPWRRRGRLFDRRQSEGG